MQKCPVVIITLLLCISSYAQDKDKLIDRVCDALHLAQTGTLDDNCIRDDETGMALSCYDISSRPEWVCDFNGDGEDDILVYFMDSGLGGGGNTFGYEYKVVIMKDGNIDDILSIFGGGKFSYGFLEIDKVENGKIYATYSENQLSRKNFDDPDPLRSIRLEFAYKDGVMMEESYQRCQIASIDKRIFKETSIFGVTRNTTINDLYELEQWEKLSLNPQDDSDVILATLSGCANLNLCFSYDIPYSGQAENEVNIKNLILTYLNILEENTRYASTFKNLTAKVKYENKLRSDEYYLVRHDFTLMNNWSADILFSTFTSGEEKFVSLIINLTKTIGNKPDDFWGNIKR